MTTIFELKFDTGTYYVNEPPTDVESWLTIKEEKYRPDKSKFVYEKFRQDYPNIKIKDSDQVYALASRSAKLNSWLANVNLEYALQENAPTFYRDHVSAEQFIEADKEVKKINVLNSEKAKEQSLAAQSYKDELERIEKKYCEKIKTSNTIAKILALNTTALPLSIQLAIDNYTPAQSSSPNQRTYSRECLINYKITLLKVVNNNPEVDIDKLITDNQVK